MPVAPVQSGEVVAGKYLVEKTIAAGGIGVVLAARHLQLNRRVALKFLLPEIATNRDVVVRFGREARAAARLRSEHVAKVLDVDELPNGLPYMVLEFLEGRDLANHIAAHGALSVEEAVAHILQAGEAIAEAHAAGIVHRDLKPANLFLTQAVDGSPVVKVLDFGISKSTRGAESAVAVSLTSSSSLMGTPLYMAPEQMQSARDVDARADIWSVGAILYELISGRPPFMATTFPELCVAVMQEQAPLLSRLRPEVPEQLAHVVARCLAKNRSERYPSMHALAEALAPFVPTSRAHGQPVAWSAQRRAAGAGPLVGSIVGSIERSARRSAPSA